MWRVSTTSVYTCEHREREKVRVCAWRERECVREKESERASVRVSIGWVQEKLHRTGGKKNGDDKDDNVGEAEAEEVWEVVKGEHAEREVQCEEYAC